MLGTPLTPTLLMARLTAIAYSPSTRWAEGALRLLAVTATLWVSAQVAAGVLGRAEPVPPPAVVRSVALVLLPWTLATLLRRWPGRRVKIALDRAEAIPWRLPSPGPGFDVRWRSGETLGVLCLTSQLPGDASEDDPWARLAAAWRPPGGWRLALRYVLFPLLLAGILFRVHQIIQFGGTTGLYRAQGLARYLEAFAVEWTVVAAHLVLWAAVVGVMAGVGTVLAALATSTFAAAQSAGRAVRLGGDLLYGAGPLALVAFALLG